MPTSAASNVAGANSEVRNALGEVLNRHGFLNGLPETLTSELAGAAQFRTVAPEEVILRQGEVNNNLYFLLIGSVDIYVDGGLVATLKRRGDLLGEMSVITNKPCSASIVAKTPVELLCVDLNEFRKVTGEGAATFDYVMYRVYSLMLADKLALTNEKAKRLEETLVDLQRAKTELQEINKQIERKVSERTKLVQAQLQLLLNTHLRGLRDSLAKNTAGGAIDLKQNINYIDEATKILEPIVQTFALDVSMKTKKVLLAQGQKQLQTLARLALGGTGAQIQTSSSLDQSRELLKSSKFDVVLVDREALPLLEEELNGSEFKISAPVGSDKGVTGHNFVYLAGESIEEQLPYLLKLRRLPHIVLLRDGDRAGSIRSMMTTILKLCSPTLFGLEKYLNVGVEVKELPVTKSTEREALNQTMRDHFSKLGVRNSILDNVAIVAEELLMNAIYDAPTDISGRPLYNKLPRTTPVELKAGEQGRFRMATDGTLLGISVEDPFGALTGKVILNYLDSCYGGRAGEMQEGKGGAGRGIHQIVENSDFVVFNVQPRRRTEAMAFFDVVPGSKEQKLPLLHYFCV